MHNRSLYTGLSALRAPDHIARTLLRRGGHNRYGEPMYRLVRSEARAVLSWGEWPSYATGTPIADRNPDAPWSKVLRREICAKPAPLYPGEHSWVLERWTPPDKWGPESVWYLPVEQGGTLRWFHGVWCPVAGPYPNHGDYTDTGYFLRNEEASEALVAKMVGLIEHALAELPPSPFQRLTLALSAHQAAEDKKYDEYGKWCEEMMREDNPFDAWSVGGQAEVHRIAEKAGIRSQIW